MALGLAESLDAAGAHDPVATMRAYNLWWANGKGVDAWDTGPIAGQALRHSPHARCTSDLETTARAIDQRLRGQTAGANALHRCTPLACAPFLDEAELLAAARQESRLTHWSPISQHSCAAAAYLCRRLLCGDGWEEALAATRAAVDELAPDDCPLVRDALLSPVSAAGLDAGGFCVAVLRCALHFVGTADSFEEALAPALKFAGPNNYCPVLVGALAGARFGVNAIPSTMCAHCRPGVFERCRLTAAALMQRERTAGQAREPGAAALPSRRC